jgi:hypothetical protein
MKGIKAMLGKWSDDDLRAVCRCVCGRPGGDGGTSVRGEADVKRGEGVLLNRHLR